MEVIKILRNKYDPSLVWSKRSRDDQHFKNLKQRIKAFLMSVSGNDLVSMLNDVLNVDEVSSLKITKMHIQALKNLSTSVNNKSVVKPKSKHHFMRPLRQAGFSKDQAKSLGFRVSSTLWQSCLDSRERHLAGRPKTPKWIATAVNNHLEQLSNVSSNRTVVMRKYADRNPLMPVRKRSVVDKRVVTARYRQTTYMDSYRLFKQSNLNDDQFRAMSNRLAFSSYYKCIDKRFKKPFLFTDLCEYCEIGKRLVSEINSSTRLQVTLDHNFSCQTLLTSLQDLKAESGKTPEFLAKIERFEEYAKMLGEISFHRSIAERQRLAYNGHRLYPDKLRGKIMIEIDYKGKMTLGTGPRLLNADWYTHNKKKATCCSFGVYYLHTDGTAARVRLRNIDVISDFEGSKAADLIRLFRHVMSLDFFKQVDQNEYVIWTDCGKQFRSAEFFYFLFDELKAKGKKVDLNFFAEKHGK
jgi:hypothetical protein